MTYKESDFPQLLEILNGYRTKGLPLDEIVKQTYELYKRVPIYIGIVGMCMEHFVNEITPNEIKNGDTIVIMDKNVVYKGKVQLKKNGKIKLKNLMVIQKKTTQDVNIKNKKIYKFNYEVLEKLWPSLSFKHKGK
ncbi:MAG: hypothetical protein NZ928_04830 [Endomicrobia bacterium]|nr:hypothetical protein [Endomicrobiia bacterium]MCX7940958.1 hypothetical protein [Endomicrobiia bacterium]MDW8055641.1 hypothetical protein [Elusimicrobiota bacterium]